MPFLKSRAAAIARATEAVDRSRGKLNKAFAFYPEPSRNRHQLTASLFDKRASGFQPLSNLAVRLAAQTALIDTMLGHFRAIRRDATVRHFLMTATFDDGITFEDAPVVDLARIELKVRRALKPTGLNAVCVFETDVLSKRRTNEHARRVIFHVHGICWTRDPKFRPIKVGKALSQKPGFNNMLGLRGVDFRSRAQSARLFPGPLRKPDRDQVSSSIAHLAYYVLKQPCYAKNLIERPGRRSRSRYDATAFRLKTALRIADIWSRITPSQAVFAVGPEASHVTRRFKNSVRAYERGQRERGMFLDKSGLEAAWLRFWATHPKIGFVPAQIRHRS